ncbi:MAG: rRNA pseudouridine synthase [Candidatus Dormibacteraeota bacterium]|nr:rRNA pseudouridine synthase [Candidatus Dormibacteraeota bacterium]
MAARRKADEVIASGRVRVNGSPPPPGGVLVVPGRDRVEVDGVEVLPGASHQYVAVNKPVGYLSAVSDSSRRPLVSTLVPAGVHEGHGRQPLHPVGRLDLKSRGLILLTDDGELSFRLQHPRHHVEKEYRVVVGGRPKERELERIRKGIELEEGRTAPAEVEVIPGGGSSRTELRVVLRQGWKRQLRRSFQAIGYQVSDLARLRIGPLQLGDLEEGKSRLLTDEEVKSLRAAVGL